MRIHRILSTYGLLVLLVILAVCFTIKAGGISNILSMDCRRVGDSMHVNWMWDPAKGCFIQQPSGAWMPVDTNHVYQP